MCKKIETGFRVVGIIEMRKNVNPSPTRSFSMKKLSLHNCFNYHIRERFRLKTKVYCRALGNFLKLL